MYLHESETARKGMLRRGVISISLYIIIDFDQIIRLKYWHLLGRCLTACSVVLLIG